MGVGVHKQVFMIQGSKGKKATLGTAPYGDFKVTKKR